MKNLNKYVKNNINKTQVDTDAAFKKFASSNELVNDSNSLLKTIKLLKRTLIAGFSCMVLIIGALTTGILINRGEYINKYNETRMVEKSLDYANEYFENIFGQRNFKSNTIFSKVIDNSKLVNFMICNGEYYIQLYNTFKAEKELKIVNYFDDNSENPIVFFLDKTTEIWPIENLSGIYCTTEIYSNSTLIDSFSFKIG